MVNRIQRFIKGPDADSPPRRRSRRVSMADLDDYDGSVDPLMKLFAASLEDTPPEMVQSMIKKLGRRQAVTALVDRIRATPLGIMPEPTLRRIAEHLVETVIATNGKPMHE
jgi:hypothetical protein